MSLRWKEIARLVEEARPLLVGSVLQKVAQVREVAGGESFLFHGFGPLGSWRSWLCLQQDHSCWVLTQEEWELEAFREPSTLVMVFRKHCMGKKILGLESLEGERLLLIHLEGKISILAELLPRKANVLLVEDWDPASRTARCLGSFRQVSLETGGLVRLRPPPAAKGPAEELRFQARLQGPYAYHQEVGKFFYEGVQKIGFSSEKRLWRQAWKSHQKKIQSALKKVEDDLAASLEAELFQKRGMALVSHLYSLGAKNFPKEKKIILDDLEIPLEAGKNFSDNAEIFFRKAKKMHRAVDELKERVGHLREKTRECDLVAERIEAAESDEDLQSLKEVFQKAGLVSPALSSGAPDKKSVSAKLFLEAESSDGFKMLCGRNQEENRQVTFRESKGNDLWLHLKGAPGAHVVVKSQKNKTVPLSTILEAAQLCLYYSKIRKGKRAEVDYTFRKNVRAIKGTLAEVTYTGNKAVYVEADPELLKKILRPV